MRKDSIILLTNSMHKRKIVSPIFNAAESCFFSLRRSQSEQQIPTKTDVAINSITNTSNSDISSCGTTEQAPHEPLLSSSTLSGVTASKIRYPSTAPI